MEKYDLTFIGHVCFDEIVPFSSGRYIAAGSAVLQGAIASSRIGMKTAVITKYAPKDNILIDPLIENDITVFSIDASESSWMYVWHPTQNVDDREMILKHNAGFFDISEMPDIETNWMHLAGISNQEFSLDFIFGLKSKGYNLSIDLQSLVRQTHPETKNVSYGDDERKKEIVSMMQRVKLDIVEAEILTGTDDLEEASKIILKWGCPEVVLTKSEGVLVNYKGEIFWEKFSNRSVLGRTGRGDTTFSAYLSRRFTHSPQEALKFAASLVSIKMESSGPFSGTLEDVEKRMKEDKRA